MQGARVTMVVANEGVTLTKSVGVVCDDATDSGCKSLRMAARGLVKHSAVWLLWMHAFENSPKHEVLTCPQM